MSFSQKKTLLPLVVVLVLIAAMAMGACSHHSATNKTSKHPKKVQMDGTFSINRDNPEETVGDADYVFLARVEEKTGTAYKNTTQIETEEGTKEISTPYTNYKITVLENMKGELETDKPIPLQKAGGISKDGSSIVTFDDDVLPEVGQSYVFLAYAQDDGSLLVSGPKSNTEVSGIDDTDTSDTIESSSVNHSSVMKTYKNALKHQIKSDRKRSVSKYDKTKD
ncbi:UNVERIFIED_ORG: hypothetical protein ABRZ91_003637 [Heyndrickxia coagulans]